MSGASPIPGYANATVRGTPAEAIAVWLRAAGEEAYVAPLGADVLVVPRAPAADVAARLAHDLGAVVVSCSAGPEAPLDVRLHPAGVGARALCDALGAGDERVVGRILAGTGGDAEDAHHELCIALGLPTAAVGAGWAQVAAGHAPDDPDARAALVHVG